MLLLVKKRQNEYHQRILYIRVSLSTNFQLKISFDQIPSKRVEQCAFSWRKGGGGGRGKGGGV